MNNCKMQLDLTEYPQPVFALYVNGRKVMWSYNTETASPTLVSGVHPQTIKAAQRRWEQGLRAVMVRYEQSGYSWGVHSASLE